MQLDLEKLQEEFAANAIKNKDTSETSLMPYEKEWRKANRIKN